MSIKIMIFFQSIFLNKIIIFFISFIFFNLESKELAKFNDWSAFAEGEGKNLACMAVSKPKKAEEIIRGGGCVCNCHPPSRTK